MKTQAKSFQTAVLYRIGSLENLREIAGLAACVLYRIGSLEIQLSR